MSLLTEPTSAQCIWASVQRCACTEMPATVIPATYFKPTLAYPQYFCLPSFALLLLLPTINTIAHHS